MAIKSVGLIIDTRRLALYDRFPAS